MVLVIGQLVFLTIDVGNVAPVCGQYLEVAGQLHPEMDNFIESNSTICCMIHDVLPFNGLSML